MWVRTVLLLTSSWLVWASQDAPEYAKQQRQALTSHAYQRAVRSPEERWARFTTGINTREGQLLLRTKRGIKDGDGHVITSFRHIPGKALNVATRLVTDISMRPHSDFFEISLKNLGATIITFLFQGAASHNIDVRPEQIRLISGELIGVGSGGILVGLRVIEEMGFTEIEGGFRERVGKGRVGFKGFVYPTLSELRRDFVVD
ncbi:hypothetical protein FJT64_003073 [Amphibalanus amphitrite]|uniref:Uncharacterized protein n=1 Tax=Amphibalanus amphitrite TaxID=1232801 RepID=A0A6A4W769_AMPAM|nr:hypothetical protein FJT64_003073 [Amphibalanus amphitrite]